MSNLPCKYRKYCSVSRVAPWVWHCKWCFVELSFVIKAKVSKNINIYSIYSLSYCVLTSTNNCNISPTHSEQEKIPLSTHLSLLWYVDYSFYMYGPEAYLSKVRRSWSFISPQVYLNILFRKLLDLALGERHTNHFLCFSTCNENGKLLFMFCRFTGSWKAQVIGWLNLENV